MTPNLEQPKTIEELRNWFKENGYEPATTRFFAGVDVRSPKAFGVYKNEFGEFVVYKNKADGTRAIRYQGEDEEFAVHELYQRFQEEIINQQTRCIAKHRADGPVPVFIYDFEPKPKPISRVHVVLFIVLAFCSYYFSLQFFLWLQNSRGLNLSIIPYTAPIVVMAFALLAFRAYIQNQSLSQSIKSMPKSFKKGCPIFLMILVMISVLGDINPQHNGYYSINNQLYYRAGSNWYHYNDYSDDWSRSYNVPSAFNSSNWEDYQNTSSHHGPYTSFESTYYYRNWKTDSNSGSSYSNDDDHDWSSNDWDSGYTDWNSDW